MKARLCDICEKPIDTMHQAVYRIRKRDLDDRYFKRDKSWNANIDICPKCWNQMAGFIREKLFIADKEEN